MIKTIKKTLLGSISILGVSFLVYLVLLLNPSLSYANQTHFGQVTVHHNQALEAEAEVVIKSAIQLLQNADIYDEDFHIQLCLNDDKTYPNLHPSPGGTAYAFLNKAIIYRSTPSFKNNIAIFSWEENNYEQRSFDLTYLLAHEMMHNLQYNYHPRYQVFNSFGMINWKLEGHAEYISRDFKNDGLLKEKIAIYLEEESKDHIGLPVFELEDGSVQILSYYKYSLVIQYLMEVNKLNYNEICELELSIDRFYEEMLEWNNRQTYNPYITN